MAFTPVRLLLLVQRFGPSVVVRPPTFFFRLVTLPNMASADSLDPLGSRASRGKPFPLPPQSAGFTLPLTVALRASRFIARLPHGLCLISGSCSSDHGFASGFLQIPPYGGHPCLWLTVPRHQGPFGTLTLKLEGMHGTQKISGGTCPPPSAPRPDAYSGPPPASVPFRPI